MGKITGTPGPDNLHDTSGNDTILAGQGNDSVYGGTGADTISTGAGDDFVQAFGLGSVVDLGDGYNGVSLDRSDATTDISIDIPHGTYTVPGLSGTLSYLGELRSGSGNDSILTGSDLHNETIFGGGGNDTISVIAGQDSVDGGAGTDTLIVDYSADDPYDVVITDPNGYSVGPTGDENGYAGIVYDNGSNNQTRFSGVEKFDITAGAGNDQIDLHTVSTGSHVVTNDGNDTVYGGSGHDTISTGAGDDFVQAFGLGSTVDLGDGYNGVSLDRSDATTAISIDIPHGTYSVPGLSGALSYLGEFRSGSGNDLILTGADQHNETISAGDGNDTIGVAAGYDIVDGGAGTDTLIVDYSADDPYGLFLTDLNGYQNSPTPDTSGYSGVVYDNGTNNQVRFTVIDKFDITAGAGNDRIDLSTVSTGSHIVTNDGADSVYGGTGADTISTGAGNDFVQAFGLGSVVDTGADNDFVSFVSGVTVDLGAGDNGISLDLSAVATPVTIDAPHGTYSGIDGLSGALTYVGEFHSGTGDDSLNVGALRSNESVYGGDGNDTIGASGALGSYYNSYVYGGAGTDKLALDLSADTSQDVVYGGVDPDGGLSGSIYGGGGGLSFGSIEQFDIKTGSGDDQVNLSNATTDLRISTGEGNDTIYGGGGFDTLTMERTDSGVALNADLTLTGTQTVGDGSAFASIEQLRFAGGAAGDFLRGGGADDVLKGGGGNDTLIGGGGNDILEGGNMNDVAHRGIADGHDSMTGGAGADTFRFDAPIVGSDDTVTDFTTGVDKVALSKIGFGIASLSDFDIVNATSGPFEGKATLIVDTFNHTISWDADGNGAGAAVLVAHGAFTTAPGDYVLF